MNELYATKEMPDEDRFVFVPEEEIKAIKTIYDKMEQAKQEFSNSKITKRIKRLNKN